jgi:putative serine protease PepD
MTDATTPSPDSTTNTWVSPSVGMGNPVTPSRPGTPVPTGAPFLSGTAVWPGGSQPSPGATAPVPVVHRAGAPSAPPGWPGAAFPGHPRAGGAPVSGTSGPPTVDPPSPPSPEKSQPSRGRGPGWPAVAGTGVGTAVLASLLTTGLFATTGLGDWLRSSTAQSTSTIQSGTSGPVAPAGDGTAPDWVAVANAVEPSVVAVQVNSQQANGEGSGVLLDAKGHVLTNNHVVSGAGSRAQLAVVLSDGRGYSASVVGTDPSTDLAVIQIEDAPSDLTPATIGGSDSVQVGDPVMAIGNPLGLADTVTTGIVSALNRPVTTEAESGDTAVYTNAVQTDAAINPGNSGGALVDGTGAVIGITSSIATLSSYGGGQSGSIGLGFAIPIDEAKDVADQLIQSGKAEHALLGVTLTGDTVTVDGAQRSAAIVGQVQDDTPAAKSGLTSEDAIIGIDGVSVNGPDSLIAHIRARRPGTAVKLTIVRDNKTIETTVTLATRPG